MLKEEATSNNFGDNQTPGMGNNADQDTTIREYFIAIVIVIFFLALLKAIRSKSRTNL